MKYAVLVNTTDSFEDCWNPFFTLFAKYWPGCQLPVYLNTETKNYSFEGINIIPVKNSSGLEKRLTWSECLLKALEKIDTNIILYVQEDYFMKGPVNSALIKDLAEKMIKEGFSCIHLTGHATNGPFNLAKQDNLLELAKRAEYKISLQAALWKKETLLKYLRKHENPWHFEIYGTRRAWRKNDRFLCIDKKYLLEKGEILPYTATGVVKGKWNMEAVEKLFAENNIKVDYNIRGIYIYGESERKRNITVRKIIDRIKSLV